MLFTLGIRNIIKPQTMKLKDFLKHLTFLLLSAVLLSSCVGNKKLVYLQDKEANGADRYEKDANLPSRIDDYLLQPGDILYVNMQKFVVGEELFSITGFEQANRIGQMQHPFLLGHNVDGEGNIDLPLLGKVKAEGRTINQLQTELKIAAMKEYPGAVVELFQLDGMVSVLGEVNRAGRYPIYKSRNTVFDIVASAGDLRDYANRSSIKILREKEGMSQIFHIDLTDVNAVSQKGFYLQNNDIVIVTPLKRRKYVTTNIQWLVSSVTAIVAIASLVVTVTR